MSRQEQYQQQERRVQPAKQAGQINVVKRKDVPKVGPFGEIPKEGTPPQPGALTRMTELRRAGSKAQTIPKQVNS